MTEAKKRGISFPTAYTVIFIVLLLAAALTYFIPAGKYAKLSYSGDDKAFIVESPKGDKETLPGTQATLEQLNVKIDLAQFTSGGIYKPVAIPGTYQELESSPTSWSDFFLAPVKGVHDTVDIMLFVLIIGGIIGILNASGAINAGFASLSRATQGREFLLIVLVTFLISLGGTTFGMAEETIALYPILIPIFLIAGYDAMVGIAAIYLGSSIGTMFSTVNPFATIIASSAAGTVYTEGLWFRVIGVMLGTVIVTIYLLRYAAKVKNDPSRSIIYAQKAEIEATLNSHLEKDKSAVAPPFTFARAAMLLLFLAAFLIMVWGVSSQDWWFDEMTVLFLIIGIVICFIAIFLQGMSEQEVIKDFVSGAADLVGVGLIIGIARGVNIIMDNGLISDTILFNATQMVQGMSPAMFVIMMMLIFIVLGFFIPSSSGLAVLSMPIMAPLADTVGLPRDIIVSAYQYGLGLMAFVTPTGLILVVLSMVHVTYDKWLKFVLPLVFIVAGFAVAMLMAQVYLA